MSSAAGPASGSRAEAAQRLERHRQAFANNPALPVLYRRWYEAVRAHLPARSCGPWWELGSGPGLARTFIPELILTDLVAAPWLALVTAADRLPARDGSLGALVLFDVLHHLANPTAFFREATRVLAPGGRVLVCDPLVSPLSYPVYRFLHEEGLDMDVDPFAQALDEGGKDPFAGNQAVATRMLIEGASEFHARFPLLRITHLQRMAGPAYPASGGFGRRGLLPFFLWRALDALEQRLPAAAFRWLGFRMLAIIEKR